MTESEEFLRALGKRIRMLRLTAELTQDELAARTDMSRSFVSLIEHGAHGIDVMRLLRVAYALNMRLSELIASTEAPGDGEMRTYVVSTIDGGHGSVVAGQALEAR